MLNIGTENKIKSQAISAFAIVILLLQITISSFKENNTDIQLTPPVQETLFTARNGKITTCQSRYGSCRNDLKFVTLALRHANIPVAQTAFTTQIARSGVIRNPSDTLTFHYYLISDGDDSLRNVWSKKNDSTGFVRKMIDEYKAPVTCYYFTENNKLVLLTYIGMPSYVNVNEEGLIQAVRKIISKT